ncbi:MAG: flagellar protein FliO/FliZ [Halioglobus sp.]
MNSGLRLSRILWRWSWMLFALALQSGGALAAANDVEPHAIFNTSYMIQVAGSLILVFGCLFGLVFLLKKLNGVPVSDRKAIRVLSSIKVGSRERIMLVEAGENQLLVGVTTGSIRTLHVFEHAVGESSDESGPGGDFSSLLRSAVHPEGKR